jgi:diacylglycerol kinase family enzyme
VIARDVELVLNRRARRLATDGALARSLLETARDEGLRVHETTSLDELGDVARGMTERRPRAVILAGGDGSYMAGATAIARAFPAGEAPPIALAPGGTVSTVLRNWGGPRAATADGAARLVRAVARGAARVTRRPTLRVTDDRGGDRVGFIFGAGLVATFFDEYYAGATQGYAGAAAIVARIFAQSFVGGPLARRVLTPVPASLTLDGRAARPEAWSLVVATVVRDLGLHMVVARRAGERLDAFHAVASPLGPALLGPQMPLVIAGRRLLGHDHVDAPSTRELVLRFPNEGQGYVLDGDVLRAREIRVVPGPAFDVLTSPAA